jgi:hypothetical protein
MIASLARKRAQHSTSTCAATQTFGRKSSLEPEQSMGSKMWRLKHHLWKIATMTQMCHLVLLFKTRSVLKFWIMFSNRYGLGKPERMTSMVALLLMATKKIFGHGIMVKNGVIIYPLMMVMSRQIFNEF